MTPITKDTPNGTRVLVVAEGKLVRTKTVTPVLVVGHNCFVATEELDTCQDIARVFLDEPHPDAIREAKEQAWHEGWFAAGGALVLHSTVCPYEESEG